MVEGFLGTLLGGLALFVLYAVVTLWIKIKALEGSSHTVVPMRNEGIAKLEKEMESFLGTKSEDLFKDLNPRELGNFTRFPVDDNDKREDRFV